MEVLAHTLRMAYYAASDGPRIVLFGPLDVDLQSLREVFQKLSRNEGPFELHTLPFVQAFGGVRIVASSSGSMFGQHKGQPQGLRRKTSTQEKEFEWKRTAEGWDYLAKLIDSLVTDLTPGHLYLTRYPEEDAIVVVSRGEYTDEVLNTL
jgi:hypothetical protein